jgi:predicted molibdopterin-dependent oxidoreductase YjgC
MAMDTELSNAHGATRIPNPSDRLRSPSQQVTITFDGHGLPAYEGEPLIAALFIGGVRVLRTMPRTGEARGGYCLVGRCSDCMVVVDGVPNCRACATPVRDGMTVETQHGLGTWSAGDV